jgi:hypothetical protein|tara:strand:+ start:1578 stop:1901 length:324 start_codon:yes stop_codon:yes gene_type:complete
MALIITAPLHGGIEVPNCYARIANIDVVKKDRSDGSFYTTARIDVYKDADSAASVDEQGNLLGETLQVPQIKRVKVTNADITSNLHEQLYTQLKEDLTARNITWKEE